MSLLISGDLKLAKDSPATWAQGGDLQYEIEVSGTRYMVHEFRTVGTATLNVLKGGNIEYLVVAGGGGGAAREGCGGGGAGGLLAGTTSLSVGSATVSGRRWRNVVALGNTNRLRRPEWK
jgi:hypothetical protein